MKHRQTVAAGLVFALCLCALQSASGAETFTYGISTTGSVNSDYLKFGFTATSTDGYDAEFDWPLPPPNVDGNDVYFVGGGSAGSRWSRDFKALGDSATWELRVVLQDGGALDMNWQLEAGSLGGNVLQLKDKNSGSLLVSNMSLTTTYSVQKSTTFLISYGTANKPPVARDDQAYLLKRQGSIHIDVLANDYDPDANPIAIAGFSQPAAGGTVDQVEVEGEPMLRYTLPQPLPGEWTGTVVFDYQISDTGGRATASATVTIEVADHVLVLPLAATVSAAPGDPLDLSYEIQRDDAVDALTIILDLPYIPDPEKPGDVIYWSYVDGSVILDETRTTPTANQVDGELFVTFDAVPADNSLLAFQLLIPEGAQNDVDNFAGVAQYSVGGIAQPDQEVPGRKLVVFTATLDVNDDLVYNFADLLLIFNKWGTYDPLANAGLPETGLDLLYPGDRVKAQQIVDNVENLGADIDVNNDLATNFADLLLIFNKWGTYDPLANAGLPETGLDLLYPGDRVKAQQIVDNVEAISPPLGR